MAEDNGNPDGIVAYLIEVWRTECRRHGDEDLTWPDAEATAMAQALTGEFTDEDEQLGALEQSARAFLATGEQEWSRWRLEVLDRVLRAGGSAYGLTAIEHLLTAEPEPAPPVATPTAAPAAEPIPTEQPAASAQPATAEPIPTEQPAASEAMPQPEPQPPAATAPPAPEPAPTAPSAPEPALDDPFAAAVLAASEASSAGAPTASEPLTAAFGTLPAEPEPAFSPVPEPQGEGAAAEPEPAEPEPGIHEPGIHEPGIHEPGIPEPQAAVPAAEPELVLPEPLAEANPAAAPGDETGTSPFWPRVDTPAAATDGDDLRGMPEPPWPDEFEPVPAPTAAFDDAPVSATAGRPASGVTASGDEELTEPTRSGVGVSVADRATFEATVCSLVDDRSEFTVAFVGLDEVSGPSLGVPDDTGASAAEEAACRALLWSLARKTADRGTCYAIGRGLVAVILDRGRPKEVDKLVKHLPAAEVSSSFSWGAARFPDEANDVRELLRMALVRLANMREEKLTPRILVNRLRRAVSSRN